MQAAQDLDLATNDLGPLAWVLDELRKSLESASSALRRFVRDAGLARGQDMASVDAGQLRIARQHMHQAVGALEMVGLGAPAHMLRAMEGAVQKFVERPELCNEAASAKVERAGFALTEYLEAMLMGKQVSPVALFPQYKEVQEIAGADRVHPADLWIVDWRWNEPQTPAAGQVLQYDPAVRSRMDQAVLKIVKSADAQAARDLAQISLELAGSQTARQPKAFWKICAGYFEAVSLGLLPSDIYVKRAASRILLQYASLAKGELGVSDRLAQDLVFFCAQAMPPSAAQAPALVAVRQSYGVTRHQPVDYSTSPFGRFDPVLLAQARKRIATAKETWSVLSGGDPSKLKSVGDHFNLVTDSLSKLHPPSAPLAQSMTAAIDSVVRAGRPPSAELAMEVATAILYLEAAFQDLDPNDSQLAIRTARLAERLDTVRQGGQAEALEHWMEELYRRVSDRQTMGSVVGELRGTLGELEKLLDQFFRNPQDKAPLADAPNHLAQMRGVLSVLGLEQASQAVQRMRETVEEIIVTEIDEERARTAGTFDKLGNNLGALGFLIDMLNYQPALAKKLFVYDDSNGELRPLMGRTVDAPHEEDATGAEAAPEVPLSSEVMSVVQEAAASGFGELTDKLGSIATQATLAENKSVAHAAREAAAAAASQDTAAAAAALNQLAAAVQPPPAVTPPPVAVPAAAADIDDELLEIFLEEAREVVTNGLAAVEALGANPADIGELTTLRRAFHTLKGSSRMVGLNEFGEAGWSMEQVLNTWLADQKPASDDLRGLAAEALTAFGRWVDDIAAHNDGHWKAGIFRVPADAMRTEQRRVALDLPGAAPAVEVVVAEVPAEPMPQAAAPAEPVVDLPQAAAADVEFDIDFGEPAPAESGAAAQPVQAEAPAMDFALPDSASFDSTQVIRAEPVAVDEIPADELPPEFAFDLDAPAAAPAVPAEAPPQIDGIDFGSLSAVSEHPEAVEISELPPEVAKDFGLSADFDRGPSVDSSFDLLPPAPAEAPAAAAEPAHPAEAESAEVADMSRDEQVKVIGTLRIGIPLYNVYLNEADEWSRRLVTEVGEWALEMNQPVPDSTVGWAHALAGSSATVGFHSLSEIARAFEGALEHTQMLAYGTPQHALAFTAAAEEIRRLLHQFAAGFLKEPDAQVMHALHELRDLDIPQREDRPEPELTESGFGDLDFAAPAAQSTAPVPVETAPIGLAPAEPAAAEPAPAQPAPVLAQPAAFVPPQAPATPAQPAAEVARDEDDIDVVDVIDPDLFPIFEEEAIELMPQLGSALRQWHAQPDQRADRDQALRALHTLKGSARLAGALRLGEMAHRLESEIEYLGSEGVNPADIEELLHRFDAMQERFDALRVTSESAEAAPAAAAPAAVAPPVQAAPAAPQGLAPQPVQPETIKVKAPLAVPTALSVTTARQAGNQAVRVRSHLLDRLVNQAGEVMITRSRLEEELRQLRSSLADLTGNLDRLRGQLREIELQAETQMQSRLAQAKEVGAGFDPLEFDRFTRTQELTRFMAESVNDIATVQRNIQRVVESTEDDLIAQARQTRELQRDLLRTRMVEFEGISDRLYRVVRLAAKETGKQVKLDIVGGSIEMDRGVLDRMTPAFEHLLRNCVAHGIEVPAARSAAGKDPNGAVVISLAQEGNDVSVEFKDDGVGLNLARIREKALQQGLITPEQQLSDAEAANLIFLPGFTTATQVTELAGRGIGMDVVRSEVNALGGRIETQTEAGRGSSFKLVLPLTTAVTQVVMIRSGNLSIGVPANLIELVRRATQKEMQQAYASGQYDFGGEMLPFFWSGALLQSSAHSVEPASKTTPVVIFRSAAQRVAVHVDEVLGNQEVVVKNLGPQLSRLPGLAGMTVLASGAVVLIYNPVALAQVYGEQARQLAAEKAEQAPEAARGEAARAPELPTLQAPPAIPLVLVVDDSITVRRVTQRLLQREGYRVALAADGLQALERLAEERPAVVLSDIEMPRMDGFDLARNIRNDQRLAGLPIIMITSRIAEKHREHAKELGVNHYLGKPYSEEELLSLVKHYCQAAVAA
jgi:chemosensory pili system protein ChpA (sensor histidine kinase/response regulator)